MVGELTSKFGKLAGSLLLVINGFLGYERSDIFLELINGRSHHDLDIGKLMLPVILLVIAIFLLRKRKNKGHEKTVD